MQRLREHHKRERRARILRAARDLVAGGGMDALTMRAVADRAQLSVPTIYNLIGSRAEVLGALLDAGGAQLDELLAGHGDDDPIDRLVAACQALVAVVAPNVDVVVAVLADGLSGPPSDGSTFGRFSHAVRQALLDARARRVLIRDADPDLLTDRLVALAAGAVLAWANGHRDQDRLGDDLVHATLIVVVAHAADGHRERLRGELNRRARRLTRCRAGVVPGAVAVPAREPR